MAYGAFQTAVSRSDRVVNGLVIDPTKAEIENFIIESVGGVTPGKVVSRGTGDKGVVVGVGTEVIGVVVRVGDNNGALGSEVDNEPVYAQYETIGVLRSGEMYVDLTGTGAAGATVLNADNTTGAIDIGAAEAGQTALTGIKLETTMAAAGVGWIRLDRNAFGI